MQLPSQRTADRPTELLRPACLVATPRSGGESRAGSGIVVIYRCPHHTCVLSLRPACFKNAPAVSGAPSFLWLPPPARPAAVALICCSELLPPTDRSFWDLAVSLSALTGTDTASPHGDTAHVPPGKPLQSHCVSSFVKNHQTEAEPPPPVAWQKSLSDTAGSGSVEGSPEKLRERDRAAKTELPTRRDAVTRPWRACGQVRCPRNVATWRSLSLMFIEKCMLLFF